MDAVAGRVTFGEAVVDDEVAVGHAGYGGHLVADEQDGGRGREPFDNVIDVVLELFVDIAQRLVEHQHVGTRDEGPAEEGALQLASGEYADALCGVFGQSHQLDCRGCAAVAFGACDAFACQARGDDLAHGDGKPRVDHVLLRQIAYGDAGVGICHRPGGGLDEVQDNAQQRCLAAAVGACDGYEVAPADVKVDALEYVAAFAAQRYVAQGYYDVARVGVCVAAAHRDAVVWGASASAMRIISSSQ